MWVISLQNVVKCSHFCVETQTWTKVTTLCSIKHEFRQVARFVQRSRNSLIQIIIEVHVDTTAAKWRQNALSVKTGENSRKPIKIGLIGIVAWLAERRTPSFWLLLTLWPMLNKTKRSCNSLFEWLSVFDFYRATRRNRRNTSFSSAANLLTAAVRPAG